MSELIKAVEARYNAFRAERKNKFNAPREVPSSDNFFRLMGKVYTQKIRGRKVDELGNIAEAQIIKFEPIDPKDIDRDRDIFYRASLKVVQPIPESKKLGNETTTGLRPWYQFSSSFACPESSLP